MNSDRFIERLKLVISREESQSDFARKADLAESSLRGYLAGKVPSIDKAAKIAKAGGVSLDWLYGLTENYAKLARTIEKTGKIGEAEARAWKATQGAARAHTLAQHYIDPEESESAEHSDATAGVLAGFVFVPKLEVEASAGFGREVVPVHQVGETVAFQESWLHRIGLLPDKAHVLTAIGDSMEPTIRDGDLLLVDTSIERVRDNGIYVVVVSGMVFVKRLHIRMDGSLVLKSDNPMYPEETIPADDTADLHVAGRVRWFGRTI